MSYRGKMRLYEMLKEDPIVAEHLPYTDWYSYENLLSLFNKCSTIYIKPNRGKQGNYIIRVRSLGDEKFKVSHGSTVEVVKESKLNDKLTSLMNERKSYIIQRGIDLATYKNKPFDMRLVLQKIYDVWQLTLTSAKVAQDENSVVTNVSKGAKDYLLHYILYSYDQRNNPLATMREIIDISHRIANVLGKKITRETIGLDLALDKEGNIWFIEANLRPQCAKCKLVNDEISLNKYNRARSIIRSKKR